jgi:hypothetical protein
MSILGLTTVAQASPLRVRCRTSALIAAINTANATPGMTLSLSRGCVYVLRAPAASGDGLPVLNANMTINGNGATIVRKSTQQFRILENGGAGANVTIRSLTLKGGHAPDGVQGAGGGGIDNEGPLTLVHVTVQGNRSGDSTNSAVPFPGGPGGGIVNAFTAPLTIIASRIVGNRTGTGATGGTAATGGPGGGIFNAGSLDMIRTTIAHNVTGRGGTSVAGGGSGAGLYVSPLASSTTIARSTITRNKAVEGGQGGGIFNVSAAVITPTRTKIVRNRPNNCAGFGPVANCHH